MNITEFLKKYDFVSLNIIKDFLYSEVDDDDLDLIIDFVKSDDNEKLKKYSDYIYQENEYDGVFLDGNQYIISSDRNTVCVIDTLEKKYQRNTIRKMIFNVNDFIFLIKNKKIFFEYCNNTGNTDMSL